MCIREMTTNEDKFLNIGKALCAIRVNDLIRHRIVF